MYVDFTATQPTGGPPGRSNGSRPRVPPSGAGENVSISVGGRSVVGARANGTKGGGASSGGAAPRTSGVRKYTGVSFQGMGCVIEKKGSRS